ncbi:MAG TPA: hypothetical protein VGM03_02325 [Phycisphaerae bacterium]
MSAAIVIGLLLGAGCRRDVRLTGQRIRHATVRTVTDQGLELGPLPADADAARVEEEVKKVAYVLLRAIHDDVRADGDRIAREAALDREFAVIAPDRVYQYHLNPYDSRDEAIHKIVRLWAPTLAYYVASFDFDWPTAREQMQVAISTGSSGAHVADRTVFIPLRDPQSPAAYIRARIDLTHENEYWRVWFVGFDPRQSARRSTTVPAATAPAPAPRTG